MTTNHTPTPWEIHEGNLYGPGNHMIPNAGGADGEHRTGLVALVYDGTIHGPGQQCAPIGTLAANAALIVRAVNAHDALVAAALDALAFLENDLLPEQLASADPERRKLLAAIKLARGEA